MIGVGVAFKPVYHITRSCPGQFSSHLESPIIHGGDHSLRSVDETPNYCSTKPESVLLHLRKVAKKGVSEELGEDRKKQQGILE